MEEPEGENTAAASTAATPPVLTIVYRSLIILALFLALCIAVISIWTVFFKPDQASNRPLGSGETVPAEMPGNVFTGIGRLRLSTADSVTVILSVNFPYPDKDKAFSEELVSRIGDFRAAAAEYFRRLSAVELRSADESIIKADLLDMFNSLLRLGKIDSLFFSDYRILE
ncbi:MAG: flagellar basal body protein FliL [Treponema sp.]|jgi:flagellar basal body-associated protein FliL|nr:flagellar basal body protein FliL [Treponema sp.]